MSVRVTMATQHMPQFGNGTLRTDATTAPGDVPVNSGTVPVVSASGAVGLWRGAKAGDTHIGEVDLIGGLNTVPTEHDGTLRIQQKVALAAELGIRIGLLEETAKAPGVAFTVSRRMAFHLSAQASAMGSDAGEMISSTAQDGNTFAGANAPRSRAYLALGVRIGN